MSRLAEGHIHPRRPSKYEYGRWPNGGIRIRYLGRCPVVYTQLIHDSGPKESQAMAKSVIRWIPTHMGCGPGEGSLRRLL